MDLKDIAVMEAHSFFYDFDDIVNSNDIELIENLKKFDFPKFALEHITFEGEGCEKLELAVCRILRALDLQFPGTLPYALEGETELEIIEDIRLNERSKGNTAAFENLLKENMEISEISSLTEPKKQLVIACLEWFYNSFMYGIHSVIGHDWAASTTVRFAIKVLQVFDLDLYLAGSKVLNFLCAKYNCRLPYNVTVFITDFLTLLPFNHNLRVPQTNLIDFICTDDTTGATTVTTGIANGTTTGTTTGASTGNSGASTSVNKLLAQSNTLETRKKLILVHTSLTSTLFLILGEEGFNSMVSSRSPNILTDLIELCRRPALDGDIKLKTEMIKTIYTLVLYSTEPPGWKLMSKWRLTSLFSVFQESSVDHEYLNAIAMFIHETPKYQFFPFVHGFLEHVCDLEIPVFIRINLLMDADKTSLYYSSNGKHVKFTSELFQTISKTFETDYREFGRSNFSDIFYIEVMSKWVDLLNNWVLNFRTAEFESLFISSQISDLFVEILADKEIAIKLSLPTLTKILEILTTIYGPDERVLILEENGSLDKLAYGCLKWLSSSDFMDYIQFLKEMIPLFLHSDKKACKEVADLFFLSTFNEVVKTFESISNEDAPQHLKYCLNSFSEILTKLFELNKIPSELIVKSVSSVIVMAQNLSTDYQFFLLMPELIYNFIAGIPENVFNADSKSVLPKERVPILIDLYDPTSKDSINVLRKVLPDVSQFLEAARPRISVKDTQDCRSLVYIELLLKTYPGLTPENSPALNQFFKETFSEEELLNQFSTCLNEYMEQKNRLPFELMKLFSTDLINHGFFKHYLSLPTIEKLRDIIINEIAKMVNKTYNFEPMHFNRTLEMLIKFLTQLVEIVDKPKFGLNVVRQMFTLANESLDNDEDEVEYTDPTSDNITRTSVIELITACKHMFKVFLVVDCEEEFHAIESLREGFTAKILKKFKFDSFNLFPVWMLTSNPVDFYTKCITNCVKDGSKDLKSLFVDLFGEESFEGFGPDLGNQQSVSQRLGLGRVYREFTNQSKKFLETMAHSASSREILPIETANDWFRAGLLLLNRSEFDECAILMLKLFEVLIRILGARVLKTNEEDLIGNFGLEIVYVIISKMTESEFPLNSLELLRLIWEETLVKLSNENRIGFNPMRFFELFFSNYGLGPLDEKMEELLSNSSNTPSKDTLDKFANKLSTYFRQMKPLLKTDLEFNTLALQIIHEDISALTWIFHALVKFDKSYLPLALQMIKDAFEMLDLRILWDPVNEFIRVMSRTIYMTPFVIARQLLNDFDSLDGDGIAFSFKENEVSPTACLLRQHRGSSIIKNHVANDGRRLISLSLASEVAEQCGRPQDLDDDDFDVGDYKAGKLDAEQRKKDEIFVKPYLYSLVEFIVENFEHPKSKQHAEIAGSTLLDMQANCYLVADIMRNDKPDFAETIINQYGGDIVLEDPRTPKSHLPFSPYATHLATKILVQFSLKSLSDVYDMESRSRISECTTNVVKTVRQFVLYEIPALIKTDYIKAASLMHMCIDIIDKIIAEEGNIELQTWVKYVSCESDKGLPFVHAIVRDLGVIPLIVSTYTMFDPISIEALSFRPCVIGLISDYLLVEEFDWLSEDKGYRPASRHAVSNRASSNDRGSHSANHRDAYSDADSNSESDSNSDFDYIDDSAVLNRRDEHRRRVEDSRGNVFRNSVLGEFESASSASDEYDSDHIMDDDVEDNMSIDEDVNRSDIDIVEEIDDSPGPNLNSDDFRNDDSDSSNSIASFDIDIVVENSPEHSEHSHSGHSDHSDMDYSDENDNVDIVISDSDSNFANDLWFDRDGGDEDDTDDANNSDPDDGITTHPDSLDFMDRLLSWYANHDIHTLDIDDSILSDDLDSGHEYAETAFRGSEVFDIDMPRYCLPILSESSESLIPWVRLLDDLQIRRLNEFTRSVIRLKAFRVDGSVLKREFFEAIQLRSRRVGPSSKKYTEPRSNLLKTFGNLVARFMFSPLFNKELLDIKPITTRLLESSTGRDVLISIFDKFVGGILKGLNFQQIYDEINGEIVGGDHVRGALPFNVTPHLILKNFVSVMCNMFLNDDEIEEFAMGDFNACIEAFCDHLVKNYGSELFAFIANPLISSSSLILEKTTKMVQEIISRANVMKFFIDSSIVKKLVVVFGSRQCRSTAFSRLSKLVFEHINEQEVLSNLVTECRHARTALISLLPSADDQFDKKEFLRISDTFLTNQIKLLRLLSVVCNSFQGERCILALKSINLLPLWNKIAQNTSGAKHHMLAQSQTQQQPQTQEPQSQSQSQSQSQLQTQNQHFALASSIVLLETMALPAIAVNAYTRQNDPMPENEIKTFCLNSTQVLSTFLNKVKPLINELLSTKPNLALGPMGLMAKIYGILDFQNKCKLFYSEVDKVLEHRNINSANPDKVLSLKVHRDTILRDSMLQVRLGFTREYFKYPLRITFIGEYGEDAGGLSREWLEILSRVILDPKTKLFEPTVPGSSVYQINPGSLELTGDDAIDEKSYYWFVGWILGRAIIDKRTVGFYFSRVIYKYLVGKPVSLADMEAVDASYYKSLVWMLENDITDVFYETFTVDLTTSTNGKQETADLVPNGSQIEVTESNKHDYVRKIVEYKLQTNVLPQLKAIKCGLREILDLELIKIFDEQELELLICGLPTIDLEDWRMNTIYEGYTATSVQVKWFWSIVTSFTNEERAKLLQFATGTSRVPVHGFAQLESIDGVSKFCIQKYPGNIDHLPTSHTCTNQLSLPEYQSFKKMRTLLLRAINEGNEGFGFL